MTVIAVAHALRFILMSSGLGLCDGRRVTWWARGCEVGGDL